MGLPSKLQSSWNHVHRPGGLAAYKPDGEEALELQHKIETGQNANVPAMIETATNNADPVLFSFVSAKARKGNIGTI